MTTRPAYPAWSGFVWVVCVLAIMLAPGTRVGAVAIVVRPARAGVVIHLRGTTPATRDRACPPTDAQGRAQCSGVVPDQYLITVDGADPRWEPADGNDQVMIDVRAARTTILRLRYRRTAATRARTSGRSER